MCSPKLREGWGNWGAAVRETPRSIGQARPGCPWRSSFSRYFSQKLPSQIDFLFALHYKKKCRRPTLRECDSSCTSAAFCRGPVRPSAGCCRSPGSCRTVGDLVGIAEPVNVFWHINLLEPDNEKNSSIISEMNWKVCAYWFSHNRAPSFHQIWNHSRIQITMWPPEAPADGRKTNLFKYARQNCIID